MQRDTAGFRKNRQKPGQRFHYGRIGNRKRGHRRGDPSTFRRAHSILSSKSIALRFLKRYSNRNFLDMNRELLQGPIQEKSGRFELADKGTLLLDEVTEIPLVLAAETSPGNPGAGIRKGGRNKADQGKPPFSGHIQQEHARGDRDEGCSAKIFSTGSTWFRSIFPPCEKGTRIFCLWRIIS